MYYMLFIVIKLNFDEFLNLIIIDRENRKIKSYLRLNRTYEYVQM